MLGVTASGASRARKEAHGVLVVHSDNGGFPCASELAGSNAPLRGCKFNWFDGGVKVPAFVYGPGVVPESREGASYAGLMHHVDWTATFLALARASDVPAAAGGTSSDSLNHWPGIANGTALHAGRTIAFSLGESYTAIRRGPLKLLRSVANASWFETGWDSVAESEARGAVAANACNGEIADGAPAMLFDLDADPNERVNLGRHEDYADELAKLNRHAGNLYATQWPGAPTYPHDAPETIEAAAAFHGSGGYIVPWGCAVQ